MFKLMSQGADCMSDVLRAIASYSIDITDLNIIINRK